VGIAEVRVLLSLLLLSKRSMTIASRLKHAGMVERQTCQRQAAVLTVLAAEQLHRLL